MSEQNPPEVSETDIAIVGMAARLPGARDVDAYWRNLRDGVESVRPLSEEQLRAEGVAPALLTDPRYVRAAAWLDDMEQFDAGFFGFSAQEARLLDPQHRHFLEVAWEALERAGHMPECVGGPIGVFAGSGMNAYMPYHLFTNPELMDAIGLFLVRHTGNDKDFLVTRLSYCLDLKGPAVNVQTACSTSLVAVHLAIQSLLSGECDLALAGGVTIELPHRRGYLFQEGEILSPDGHCRAFDHRAQGTVFGSGCGVLVLRRAEDAVRDGDHIHALVRGTAINNDGARKVGYLAPSVDGQAEAVVEALTVAGLEADDISYVECHGTGTRVGDPIEVQALTQAFRTHTERTGFCRIGSVKTNIGHLDTAAGVASLIKVAHMLEHEEIAPTLHFEAPNPDLDLDNSPFFVAAERGPWQVDGPRRAGVSSLGVGGTNAHVILEQAPARPAAPPGRARQPLVLSARTRTSLDAASDRLATWLSEHDDARLDDVAWTLWRGRRRFEHHRIVTADSPASAARALRSADRTAVQTLSASASTADVAFLFPGGGAQHPGMLRAVYDREPAFRAVVDEALSACREQLSLDLAPLWWGSGDEAAAAFRRPRVALPALLAAEVALARLWMAWGIEPAALIGHSLGEYACAHLAGVLSLADALRIVECRGRLFETLPPGGMLSVPLDERRARDAAERHGLELAAVNAPEAVVLSGESAAIDAAAAALEADGVEARRLRIDVAAHSSLLAPILDEFRAFLGTLTLSAPERPWTSNLTGTDIDPDEVVRPDYWVRHLSKPVRFADGLADVLHRHPECVLLEVGPGQALSSLARAHDRLGDGHTVVPSARHPREDVDDHVFLLGAAGRARAGGAQLDDAALFGEGRRRVPLPTYAFDHERCWIEPGDGFFLRRTDDEDAATLKKRGDLNQWLYAPRFLERELSAAPERARDATWLVFAGTSGIGHEVAARVRARGDRVALVELGERFEEPEPLRFRVRPDVREDAERLVEALAKADALPNRIAHFLAARADDGGLERVDEAIDRALLSLLKVVRELAEEDLPDTVELVVGTTGLFRARPHDELGDAAQALALGPALVIPQELAEVRARLFDAPRTVSPADAGRVAESVIAELDAGADDMVVAWRGGQRLVQAWEPPTTPLVEGRPDDPLATSGTVLITGGLGGLGLTFASHVASRTPDARLALVGRSGLPPRDEWDDIVGSRDPSDPLARRIHAVRELEASGAHVVTFAADVGDREQMRSVIEEVEQELGPVRVVLHAAGVLDDAPLQLKTVSDIEAVLAPKVRGALVLDELLRERDVALFCLFSSTSAVLGPPGQIDYVAANAFLGALAARRDERETGRSLAVGWGVWRDVGMAVRAASGARPAARGDPVAHPLLSRCAERGPDRVVFSAVYDPAELWVLDEHRVRAGGPVLPGTAYLEVARAAFAELTGEDAPVEIRDAFFTAPLEFPDETPREVRVSLERGDDDAWAFRVESRANADDREWTEHARAEVARLDEEPPPPVAVDEVEARCRARVQTFEPGQQMLPQDRDLLFGPRWKVLTRLAWGDDEAVARLRLADVDREGAHALALHPGGLDMASGFAFPMIDDFSAAGRVYVPLSYRRVRVFGPFPDDARSVVRRRRARAEQPDTAVFDVAITDAQGAVRLQIDGYVVRGADPRTFAARVAGNADEPSLLDRWLAEGVTPAEGPRALALAIARTEGAEVVVSPLDLYRMMASVRAPQTRADPDGAADAPKPADPNAEDAPRDDVERTLADLWRQLLGADRVGIHDDFFELGGHSLIAVRLFGRIKKAYGVDLGIATLFEAPTIEGCAALIREELGLELELDVRAPAAGNEGGAPPDASVTEKTPAGGRAFRPLVSIQRGGDRLPFFCVHGAGGNVLNFVDLSRHLGADVPFFGLQAAGVDGKRDPLDRIEDMADLYLSAIRDERPTGPYLLGGYSGGGVVALEMAQRLRAAGEVVPLVVLFDTFRPGIKARRPSLQQRLQRVAEEGASYLSRRARRKLSRDIERLSIELQLRFFLSRDLPLPHELRNHQLTQAFFAAAERYRPRPYDGRVLLFRARQIADVYAHVGRQLGWDGLLSGLRTVEVPGDHDSLVLEPNVQVIIAGLRDALDEAQRDT